MRIYYEVLKTDGTLDCFGPYDATGDPFHRVARYWARTLAKAGGVKACHIFEGSTPIACYRSKPNGGYQVSRGYKTVGALAKPVWRG